MKIVIAGGSGFVGTNVTNFLLKQYPKTNIVAVDDLSYSSTVHIEELMKRKNYTFIEESITDKKAMHALIKQHQPDIIISAVNTYDPAKAINTFVLGNTNLLEAAVEESNDLSKFILLSDDEVYGDSVSKEGNIRNAHEADALIPTNPLVAAQASADLLTLSYFNGYQLPTVVLRSSNVYGPYQSQNRLLIRLLTHALKNESIPIYGDGLHTRDWLYIDDYIELIDIVIHHKDPDLFGQAFNVATQVPYTVLETTELLLTIMNKPKEYITFDHTIKPNTYRKSLDASKTKDTFDWQPKTELKEGLKMTIDWFNEHTFSKTTS